MLAALFTSASNFGNASGDNSPSAADGATGLGFCAAFLLRDFAMAPSRDKRTSIYYEAIGRALTAFSHMENALAAVFLACASKDGRQTPLECAYWSIISFEARLKATDAIVSTSFPHIPSIATEWNAICNRIGKKHRNRSKLAHGTVISAAELQIGPRVFRAETFLAPYFFAAHDTKAISLGDFQKPDFDVHPKNRLPLKNIQDYQRSFEGMTERLWALKELINANWVRRKRIAEHFCN